MSYNSPEKKLYTLAMQNTQLQADLGMNPFRWFDRQIAQTTPSLSQIFGPGRTCVRVLRISTYRDYLQTGIMNLSRPRWQIEVLDTDPEIARSVAADIISFMGTVDLCSTAQFGSPITTPPQFPCFLLNQRARMDYELQPAAYVESMDWRVFNREDL